MGRRKKSKKIKISSQAKVDIITVGLIVASILLMVLIYAESGIIGRTLSPLLGGLFGGIKYILPIGVFFLAISIACKKEQYLFEKVLQYIILLACISSIMSIYQISNGNIDISQTIGNAVKAGYIKGVSDIGGGAIGTLIALPLCKLFGVTGATITTIGISVMLAVFIFGVRPSQIIEMIIKRLEERKEERKAAMQQAYEERLENEEKLAKARLKEIKKKQKENNILNESVAEDNQIKINGMDIDEQALKGLKKYKHGKDDLVPLGMEKESKEENNSKNPEFIEENLFKKEEEKKEEKVKEVLVLEHALTVEDENYEFPPIELLSQGEKKGLKGGKKTLTDTATKLQKTLYSFGVSAKVENVSVGPAITRYELRPAEGVRVSKIANLADDIALNLAAPSIRIEAPIPGKQAVGIEIPNVENEMVHIRDVMQSEAFTDGKSKLGFALGKDVGGEAIVADIAKMPHVLIAGSTGSGKSVCINTIIASIIYKAKPSEVKLVMVDPKVVELSIYNGIPHLLIPVVTDPKKAAGALAWAVQEMTNRYSLFAKKGVRDIKGYNAAVEKEGQEGKLPQIVIIIDELADLMMVASKDVEDAICRLAQMARAAGMHLVIATQRPSVDVITGIIKANIPSRIAFAVSSQVDSRTILDMVGAEKLLGKGDMLYYPAGAPKPVRVQGAYISDKEVEKIVDFLKAEGEVTYSEDIIQSIERNNMNDKQQEEADEDDDTDPFLMEAIDVVVETGQASASFIQRRFKVGYARAGRIIDQMESRGIISGYQGSKPREVLVTKERWAELKMQTSNEE